jgi:hypothetical protein
MRYEPSSPPEGENQQQAPDGSLGESRSIAAQNLAPDLDSCHKSGKSLAEKCP